MTDTDTDTQARQDLVQALRPLIPALDAVDPGAPEAAADQLEKNHPFRGSTVVQILDRCRVGLDQGWLVPHDAGGGVRFGRIEKDLGGYTVDAVVMKEGQGRGHTHPRGELNLCFPLEGSPLFDGHAPGWVILPPASHHVPTVKGGTMLFVYFTPGGEVVWDAPPAKGRTPE
jgi:hypothetical protein